MKLKRSLATGATVVIAGLSLVACGSDDDGGGDGGGGGGDAGDAPADASTEEFCSAFTDLNTDLSGGESPEEQADAAHELADKFADVGTPEDIPDDARNGFEVFIDFMNDVDADDIAAFEESDPDGLGDALGVDEDEVADVTAFFTYAATACVGAIDIPTEGTS